VSHGGDAAALPHADVGHVHIDPLAVASVEEAECRPPFGRWHRVAVITMVNGDKLVVADGAWRAAWVIRKVKEKAATMRNGAAAESLHPLDVGSDT
jgi:hypothetical protein